MTVQHRKSRFKVIVAVIRDRYPTGLAVGLPVMGLFVLLALLSPAYYRAVGKLKINPVALDPSISKSSSNQDKDLSVDLEFLKSNALIAKTMQELQQAGESLAQMELDRFRRSLELNDNSSARTISVAYSAPRATTAAAVVNTHMQVFQSQKLQQQKNILVQVQKQIDNRLPQAKEALAAAETALNEFNQKYRLVTANASSDSMALAVNQSQQELSSLQQQYSILEQRRSQILQELGASEDQADTLANVGQSKEFLKKTRELRQLGAKLNRLQTQLTEEHPEIVALKRDIELLRSSLNADLQSSTGGQTVSLDLLLSQETKEVLTQELGELDRQGTALASRIKNVSQSLDTLKQNAVTLPQLEQQSQNLERQLSQVRQNYEGLVRQKKEISQALADSASEVQILNQAPVPLRKIAPLQKPLLAMGLLTSLALASLGMWIAHRRDRSLKTVEDTEQYLGLKVLGVIPHFPSTQSDLLYDGDLQRPIPTIFPVDQPGSPASEAFRMLYLNLKVLPKSESVQTLAITSSIPQEGKSTIAANLAAVIAQSGKSVLLIDGNLNSPFQSLIWNLPNDLGLSNILLTQTSFLLAVKPISTNLDVLTAGTVKDLERNPLESKQMKLFIADMASRYDCIIFDLPAVNVSVDATVVSQMVDGVILVSRPGALDEWNASKAQGILQRSQVPLLGMVLNGSDDPRDRFLVADSEEFDEGFQEIWDEEAESGELLPGYNDFSNLGQAQLPGNDELALAHAFGQHSLPELESHLEELQSQWAASKRLLDNKEEELIHLCQARKELEQQLNEMRLSLTEDGDREAQLERINDQIQKTDSRREHLLKTITSLRERLKVEQDTFYAHLKVLQARHSRSQDSFTDDRPTV